MSKPLPKPTTAHAPPGQPSKGPQHKGLLDEDTLHVPKGIPRWQFLSLIVLMIFLLITFLVPNALFGIAGGGGERNPVFASWERPGHGTVEWRVSDVQAANQALDPAFRVDPFLAFLLGIDTGKLKPEDIVRIQVLDQLAEDSGLRITDADLAEHLRSTLEFQRITLEDFKLVVAQLGVDQVSVENGIRRVLRAARFLQLVAFAGVVPDPAKIEEQWKRDHAEFAFDYAELPVEALEEEARLSLPDDAGLKAWFDALPEEEKEELKTAEKRKAELVLFRGLETNPATELVAAFPEKVADGTQPTTPEELADQYYKRVFHRRFVKPAEERTEGAEDAAPDAEDEASDEFRTFEEVKEQCLAEAPVYFALQRWLDDLKARKTNGETIDLAAEAEKYGLEHQSFPEPLTRDEFATLEGIGDRELADALFTAPADGSFYWSVLTLPQGLVVLRANERAEPVLPPFEEIREQAAEKWVEPKARELALARLKTTWEGFETFEPPKPEGMEEPPAETTVHRKADAEAFRAAVEGAGLQLGSRAWLDRAGPASKDPQWQDPAHGFLFSQAGALRLYDLESDEVAEPALGRDNQHAYLVRLAGEREVPIASMSPSDYDRYKQTARGQAMAELGRALDLVYLEQNFGLKMLRGEEAARAQAQAGANRPTDDE